MNNLPNEMIWYIAQYLSFPDILLWSRINKRLSNILNRDSFWRTYFYQEVNKEYIICPQWMINGCWKRAFIENYSCMIRDLSSYHRGWVLEDTSQIIPRYYSYYEYNNRLIPVFTPNSFNKEGKSLGYSSTYPRVYDLLDITEIIGYPYHHYLKVQWDKLIICFPGKTLVSRIENTIHIRINSVLRLINHELRFTPGITELLDYNTL